MTDLNPGEYDATLNGIRFHYTLRGSGPALIAISGGPGFDARAWDDFAKIDQFVTVIQHHPRGSGLSEPASNDAYLLADYASDVEELRKHLKLDKPIVMGWSHGGMIAQRFAFTYPDSLSKLILKDTAAYFGEFLSDVEASVTEFKDQLWYADSLAALKQEWANDYQTDEDMARLWTREAKFYFKHYGAREAAYNERIKDLSIRIAPLRAFNEKEAPTLDLRPHLNQIKVPTLVIVGRHDFITNVAMAEELVKHIPHARLEIFEDSGHFAVIEEPEKFYRVVKEFVLS
ncbi:MAG TPA: alpha/beta hydrolase [Anaerolineae bacterium]|nr:alpha/beta hydrolase [Anaerolineae bacterium]